MKLHYSAVAPLLAALVAPSLAQNCGNKGKVETEIRYDNNPEANEVAFTQSGAPPGNSRDTFVLKAIDDNDGLNGATREYSNCLETRSLYNFNLKDLGSDGIQDPGFFQVTANGRQVLRDGPFEFDQYNAFFSLDRENCEGTLKRFSLDLTFDNFPAETTWSLKLTANNGAISSTVLDHMSSLPDGETTYRFSEFSESTLYVDACITPGDFVFVINDSANDGMSGSYKMFLEGEELTTTGNGKFKSTWQEKFSVAAPPPVDTGGGLCFPATATANVQDRGAVAMKDLKIGDLVQTDNNSDNSFERIYSFGHYAPEAKADFVTIITTNNDAKSKSSSSLELSPDHMVLRDGTEYVRASMLTPGDALRDTNGNDVTIQSISSIPTSKTGIYAPFTPSGKIVVNGIQTSTYSDILSEHGTVFGFFSFQWIAHSFEFPHRIACHYFAKCPAETYTAEGVSTWMAAPRQAAAWLLEDLEQHPFLQTICMALFLTTMVVFHGIETIFFVPPSSGVVMMSIAAAAVAGFVLTNKQKKKLDY